MNPSESVTEVIPTYPPLAREKILSGGDPYLCGVAIVIKTADGKILTWNPVKSLKTHHKRNYRMILREVYGVKCHYCGEEVREGQTANDLDHLDGDTQHNCFHNLLLAHHDCNPSRYHKEQKGIPTFNHPEGSGVIPTLPLSVCVIEPSAHAEWVSREGRIGEKMREAFSRWLYDTEKPFATFGTQFYPKTLAKTAVHKVGLIEGKLRSDVTYQRYLDADVIGGLWKVVDDQYGEDMIERTDIPYPFPENVRAQERKEEAAHA